ncbi:MAG TPA: response regulator, partial [Candidatus Aminicenantes bacterium]|nr:response regulator [Candidatus Aminicenantes bacterium]
MANVLIVDDDKNFLLSLVDGLKALDDQFHVLTAENGARAEEVLHSEPIDLVMTDLKMPVMDGFELLARMSRGFPRIPVIVITAFGTPEIEKNIRAMGGFQYLEKPLDFALTVERIYEGLEAKSNGFISGVSLPSFLQLMEVEQKTCLLTIHDKGRSGSLYFQTGQLIDAELENLRGDAAALEITSWDEPEIEINPKYKKRARRIESSLHFILMEACRLKDERNRDRPQGEPAVELELEEISISYEEPTGDDAYLLPADREIPDREVNSNGSLQHCVGEGKLSLPATR